jgi:hypothetical protein
MKTKLAASKLRLTIHSTPTLATPPDSGVGSHIVDSMDPSARHLAFHGSIVLLFGLLCGAPYGRAINRGAPAHIIHSWRVAHASLPIGAILMFAVAALLSSFVVATQVKWFVAIALIVSVYAFCFSLPLAAIAGHRGLSSRGPLAAKLVFLGNALGSIASLAASIALVYAGYESL